MCNVRTATKITRDCIREEFPFRRPVVLGQTVTWDNQTNDAHTISVVAPGDVPKTVDQVGAGDPESAHL